MSTNLAPLFDSRQFTLTERFAIYDYLISTPHVIHLDPIYGGGILIPLITHFPDLKEEICTTWLNTRPEMIFCNFHGPINPDLTTFVCPGAGNNFFPAPNRSDIVALFMRWQERLVWEHANTQAPNRYLSTSMLELSQAIDNRWDSSYGTIFTREHAQRLTRWKEQVLNEEEISRKTVNVLFWSLTGTRDNIMGLINRRVIDGWGGGVPRTTVIIQATEAEVSKAMEAMQITEDPGAAPSMRR